MDRLGSFYLFYLISHHSVFPYFLMKLPCLIFHLKKKKLFQLYSSKKYFLKTLLSGMPILFFPPFFLFFFSLYLSSFLLFVLLFIHKYLRVGSVLGSVPGIRMEWWKRHGLHPHVLTVCPSVTDSCYVLPSRFSSSDRHIILFDFFSLCWPIPSMSSTALNPLYTT